VHAVSITDNGALLSVPSDLASSNGGFEIAVGTDSREDQSHITRQRITSYGLSN
jgi:hypothetical protein